LVTGFWTDLVAGFGTGFWTDLVTGLGGCEMKIGKVQNRLMYKLGGVCYRLRDSLWDWDRIWNRIWDRLWRRLR
jgi:hypothetical protein